MKLDNKSKGVDFIGIAVVYFCHDGQGHILMHKRSAQARDEHGNWDIGAGSLEFEDSVEETLKKEIREEYGCDVLRFDFLGFRDVRREHQGRPNHWLTLDFKVLVNAAQAKNGEPHKFEEIGWFTLQTLPSPLHSQLPYFLQKYKVQLL